MTIMEKKPQKYMADGFLPQLVSYFDFQAANSTAVSDVYWKKVTSLATNTGGNCMFFQ